MISTIETCYQQFNHEEADGSKIWGPGKFHRVMLDEAHRLRTSGTPSGKLRKADGTLVEMDSRDYDKHMASRILSLEPQYQSILMAIPLLNGVDDLRWILPFLESSS